MSVCAMYEADRTKIAIVMVFREAAEASSDLTLTWFGSAYDSNDDEKQVAVMSVQSEIR